MKIQQDEVVNWLLENGVDREKQCYHDQKPLDVIGQCRPHTEAESRIRKALSAKLTSECFESCRFVLEQKVGNLIFFPSPAAINLSCRASAHDDSKPFAMNVVESELLRQGDV